MSQEPAALGAEAEVQGPQLLRVRMEAAVPEVILVEEQVVRSPLVGAQMERHPVGAEVEVRRVPQTVVTEGLGR